MLQINQVKCVIKHIAKVFIPVPNGHIRWGDEKPALVFK